MPWSPSPRVKSDRAKVAIAWVSAKGAIPINRTREKASVIGINDESAIGAAEAAGKTGGGTELRSSAMAEAARSRRLSPVRTALVLGL
jgi:hypothetical protein